MTTPGDAESRFPHARVSNVALLAAVAFAALALRRYATFHNETFDLAFYARLVWGLGRGDFYQPLTDSYVWGLHASPVLVPLALLGRLVPLVPLLLVVQAALVAGAGIPLARIAARRAGHPAAADAALLAYLLYPTVSTAATYEFHPGSLALFPLALALDYFDRRLVRRGLWALAAAVACREDVALVAALTGLALAARPEHRRVGVGVFALGVAYFALYLFVLAPRFLPRHGSLQLHYGHLGSSPAGVVRALLLHPVATLREVATPAKLLYGPRLLAPLAFLSLLAPRWLLPALVPYAINFLSAFPTAVQIQSHYATLAIPFVFASAAHGVGRLAASAPRAANRYLALAAVAVALGTLHMHRRAGATPLSRRWDPDAFRRDARGSEVETLLALIPPGASVAAPDYVLPHVAERSIIHRVPWRYPVEYGIVSVAHRARFEGTQNLWRNAEEVFPHNLLAGRRYGLYAVAGQHLLFRKGWPVRAFARGRYVAFQPRDGARTAHVDVGPSVALAAWAVRPEHGGTTVTLFLVARTRWPHDLGIELGWGPMHPVGDREDPARIVAALPFDGLFSPVHVRVGEVARTEVWVPEAPEALVAAGVYLGVRRVDGSRLDPGSAHWSRLPGTGEPRP